MTDRRTLRPQYHVRASSKETEEIYDLAARYAAFHGFCCIKADVKDLCSRAVADARLLDSQGDFQQTQEVVVDGLLGEGSRRTVDLGDPEKHPAISQLDELLSRFAEGLGKCHSASDIGVRNAERTDGLLHEAQAGLEDGPPPSMTEAEAQRWLPTFLRHQLMLILFLGPAKGVLELQPYDEEGHPFRVATEPGMLAIVRTDSLWRRFTCIPGAISYSLSCFLLSQGEASVTRSPDMGRTPIAEQLDLWLLRRIEDVAASKQDERWSYALDHMYHKTEQFAVRGMACKLSAQWDTEGLSRAILAGGDMATEVPSVRWDHTLYYSDDFDDWRNIKVGCNHTSMIDGIELFDARFFRIAPAEVKGMDPIQRQVLEVGYAALVAAGQTSKTLLTSLTAVYVASPSSEWTLVDQGPEEAGGCAQRSAGTGVAPSIMSNRFSFVFGMNGPSVTFDTEASTSLVCLEAGVISLDERRCQATMSSCTGCLAVLTPLTWVNRFAMGHMTMKGRCFTYDDSADGWFKSDHFVSAAVDRLTNTVDGVAVQDESRDYIGTIGGVSVTHMGQAASLGTPHGPAVQKVIVDACRQAAVAPGSLDAMETMGCSHQLHDAVEVNSYVSALNVGPARIPLHLSSVRTNLGNGIHGAGLASLAKVIRLQGLGILPQGQHLYRLNPMLQDITDVNLGFGVETISCQIRTSLYGIAALGWGGTLGFAVCTGGVDPIKRRPAETRPPLMLWPGGGGRAPEPTEAYYLCGSWNAWDKSDKSWRLEPEGGGVFAANIELGASGTEDFCILLDTAERILEPQPGWAQSGSRALLASHSKAPGQGSCWTITGQAKENFRVHLVTSGKWQVVTWQRS